MNVIEINRLHPQLHGKCWDTEWSSPDQIGEFFHGRQLTREVYLDVEDRFVAAITAILDACEVSSLFVHTFERWTPGATLALAAARLLPHDGLRVAKDEIGIIVRACLREDAWMQLVLPHTFLLHFGYDMRVFVACQLARPVLGTCIRDTGLFYHDTNARFPTLDSWRGLARRS